MTCDTPSPCVRTSECPSIHPPPIRIGREIWCLRYAGFLSKQKITFSKQILEEKNLIVKKEIWAHIFWSTFLLVKTIHLKTNPAPGDSNSLDQCG